MKEEKFQGSTPMTLASVQASAMVLFIPRQTVLKHSLPAIRRYSLQLQGLPSAVHLHMHMHMISHFHRSSGTGSYNLQQMPRLLQ